MTVPSFDLPPSVYASAEYYRYVLNQFQTAPDPALAADLSGQRADIDERFYGPKLELLAHIYPYISTKSTLGGVPVETFEPKAGVAPENQDRVLLNLHGGAFMFGGGGMGGAAESIPIAVLGRVKVIAIDYRLAPEHQFPAASEDLESVYRELLKSYSPGAIGIYGCSAGGMICAQAVPWFKKHGLPLPAAIGIFCASAHRFSHGDSGQIWPRMQSARQIVPPAADPRTFSSTEQVYFGSASPDDALAVPAASRDVLKQFPPTLFVTSTRAPEMSGAAQSHLELLELGVKSQLLIVDGVEHGFVVYPIPEATRVHQLAVKFFMEHLQ